MKRFVQWARKGGSVCRPLAANRRMLVRGLAMFGLAAAMSSQPAAAADYTLLDLGTLGPLPIYGPTMPNAINASGQVVGQLYNGQSEPHGFLNDLTGMYDLGALNHSGNISGAYAINDAGQIVGYSQIDNGRVHGWLYSGGVMRDLGTLGGVYSSAADINNAGQVVGVAEVPGPDEWSDGPTHAFLYDERSGMRDLGPGAAIAINDAGQIVGYLNGLGAVLWENGTARVLGTLPGYPVINPADINQSGQIVGTALNLTNQNRKVASERAFLFDGAGMRSLGTLGGDYSSALGINSSGQVVGWSLTSGTTVATKRAFLYKDGVMLDLNGVLPAGSGWTLVEARAINDSGQIVGVGTHGGLAAAFLLTPGVDARSLLPRAPTGLTAHMVSNTQIDLSWADNSNNEWGFELQLKRNGEWTTIATYQALRANGTNFSHTGLASYANYTYRVRAVNGTGASAWSNESDTNTGVRPHIQISATDIDFGSPAVGSHTTRSVEVENLGNGPLRLGDITLAGGNASEFTLAPSTLAGTTIAPGSRGLVTIVFTPVSPHDIVPPHSPDATRLTIAHDDPSPEDPSYVVLRGGGTGGAISISPASLDFGMVPVGTTGGSQGFLIQNSGNDALDISSIKLTGANPGDFELTADGATGTHLLPGRVGTVSVRFTPTASGRRAASLAIEDNAVGNPHLVALSGTGTAPIATLKPGSLSFGEQLVGGSSADQAIVLSNTGSAPLTIYSVGFSGANPGDFSTTADISGFTLAPGQSGTLKVRFAPHATGSRSASLAISDSAPGGPHTVALSGRGIAPAVNLGISRLNGPGSLSFGRQALGTTSSAQSVTLTNSGTAPLTIHGVSLDGASAGDFLLASDSGSGTLPPGASRTFSLRFAPRAAGNRSASLTISDDAPGSPRRVALEGDGVAISPPAPTSLAAQARSAGQVTLMWSDNSGNETAFALWRKSETSGWTRIAVLPPNRTSYVDRGVTPETDYTYRVRAINNSGASGWTNEADATTPPPAPGAPSGLIARGTGVSGITLMWHDNSANETAFAVWRKESGGGWVRIGVAAVNAQRFVDLMARAGTSYLYRVRATNNHGASDWSNEAAGTTGAP